MNEIQTQEDVCRSLNFRYSPWWSLNMVYHQQHSYTYTKMCICVSLLYILRDNRVSHKQTFSGSKMRQHNVNVYLLNCGFHKRAFGNYFPVLRNHQKKWFWFMPTIKKYFIKFHHLHTHTHTSISLSFKYFAWINFKIIFGCVRLVLRKWICEKRCAFLNSHHSRWVRDVFHSASCQSLPLKRNKISGN